MFNINIIITCYLLVFRVKNIEPQTPCSKFRFILMFFFQIKVAVVLGCIFTGKLLQNLKLFVDRHDVRMMEFIDEIWFVFQKIREGFYHLFLSQWSY